MFVGGGIVVATSTKKMNDVDARTSLQCARCGHKLCPTHLIESHRESLPGTYKVERKILPAAEGQSAGWMYMHTDGRADKRSSDRTELNLPRTFYGPVAPSETRKTSVQRTIVRGGDRS